MEQLGENAGLEALEIHEFHCLTEKINAESVIGRELSRRKISCVGRGRTMYEKTL